MSDQHRFCEGKSFSKQRLGLTVRRGQGAVLTFRDLVLKLVLTPSSSHFLPDFTFICDLCAHYRL